MRISLKKSSIFVLTIFSFLLVIRASKASFENCEDFLNFMIDSEGRCVNLDELTNGHNRYGQSYDNETFRDSNRTNQLDVNRVPDTIREGSRASIQNIGTLDFTPKPATFSGFVGFPKRADYYEFQIQASSNFRLELSQLDTNANALLLNDSGEVIQASRRSGSSDETITEVLEPGTYYAVVRLPSPLTYSRYTLNLQAQFIADVVELDTAGRRMPDPEFDQIGYQVTWQDDEESLWVMPIDPRSGNFVTDRAVLLETGLAPNAPLSSGLATGNGPEWIYTSEGSQILYTWQNPNDDPGPSSWRVGRARQDGNEWDPDDAELISPVLVGGAPNGSKTPDDQNPLFNFFYEENGERIVAWRNLNGNNQPQVIPIELSSSIRWVPGERFFVSTVPTQTVSQVIAFDVDTQASEQLTFDFLYNKLKPQMWRAPEFSNTLVFFALEALPTDPRNPIQLGIYHYDNSRWQKINILKPLSNLPFIDSPEPFVYNNFSYVSFSTVNDAGESEVWIAGIDPEREFYRQVSDPEFDVASTDAEPFMTENGAFIYFSRGGGRSIFRAETGLGPPISQ